MEVATALGADLSTSIPEDYDDLDIETSAYAIVEIPGGVLAIEYSGYADPSLEALRQVTTGGRDAAVVRSNILVHYRFGCAKDGHIVFDDDEFAFVDPARVPRELRALFDGVRDLQGDVLAVGLAMAEVVTGVRVTAEDLQRASNGSYYEVSSTTYLPDET